MIKIFERMISMDADTSSRELNVDQIDPCPLPFCASRDDLAPTFSAEAYLNEQIYTLNIEDFREKWKILFFYASDFTFV